MKHNIHYSRQALQDLDDIWSYIVSEYDNTRSADRIVNHIMEAVDRLKQFPEMGAPLSSVTETESDYRFLVSGQYLSFYHLSQNQVLIDRILNGRRDYLRILFGLEHESNE